MLLGFTANQFANQIDALIQDQLSKRTQQMLLAFWWRGQAEAYDNIECTSVTSGWGYYRESTRPSSSCQRDAKICRQNEAECLAQAKVHEDKAAQYRRTRAAMLAAGRFDPEEY